MKKLFAAAAVIFFTLSSCITAFALPDENLWDDRPAKKIHYKDDNVVRSYEYSYDGNTIQEIWQENNGQPSLHYIYDFDAQGNLLKSTCYLAKTGELSSVETYDKQGNPLMVQLGTGRAPVTYDYTYNEQGQAVSCIRHEGGGDAKEVFIYDDKGNRIQEIGYLYDGVTVNSCVDYLYNEQGQLIVKATSGQLMPLPFPGFEKTADYYLYWDYAYDSEGRLVKAGNTFYEYDNQGRLAKSTDTASNVRMEYIYE